MSIKYLKTKSTTKSFSRFLMEVNYGALEKDPRINKVANILYQDILQNIKKLKFNGKVVFDDKDLFWKFNFYTHNEPYIILGGGTTKIGKEAHRIEFDLNVKDRSNSVKQAEIIKSIINSNELDEVSFHEIKHTLDNQDDYFRNKQVRSVNIDSTDKDKIKYVSGNEEIDAQLISVLLDLKYIHIKNPNISYHDAIEDSNVYDQFLTYLKPSKKNKCKQKIAYY